MANENHVEVVRQGAEAVRRWREQHRRERLDLAGADLIDADLIDANLTRADLTRADLTGADLALADLALADLSGADLSGEDLTDADLTCANLTDADLTGADLTGADLTGADLTRADLTNANLTGAYLSNANLLGANLLNTDFSDCRLRSTILAAVDLSTAAKLATAQHTSGSEISTNTLSQTLRGCGGTFTPDLLHFFELAGISRTLLDYLPSILGAEPLKFYSCFISYNTDDEEFASGLEQELTRAGVKTWKWNLNALAGRDLRENIDRAIHSFDKMILVCSSSSLKSPAVEQEIERALRKEDGLKKSQQARNREALERGEEPPQVDTDVLVPIMLDDTVLNWNSQYAADVTRKYIPKFATRRNTKKYKAELDKLIYALKPGAWPPTGPLGESFPVGLSTG